MNTNAPAENQIDSLIKGKIITGTIIVAMLTATVAGLNAVSPLYAVAGNTLPNLTGVVYVFITAFVTSAIHIGIDYFHGLPSNIVDRNIRYQDAPLNSPVSVHNYPPPLTPTITIHNHPMLPTTDIQRTNYEMRNEKSATEEKMTMDTSPLSIEDEANISKGEEDTLKIAFPKELNSLKEAVN